MTGHEFEARVRKLGRMRGVVVSFDSGRGKGSHGRLYFGSRFTTLKRPAQGNRSWLLSAMLHQLGLTRKDLEIQ
jgi:hypothetical protein